MKVHPVYQEDCPGCRIVLVDPKTGQKLPDDDPLVQQAQAIFNKLNVLEKEAWHRATCLNSRTPADLAMVRTFLSQLHNLGKP